MSRLNQVVFLFLIVAMVAFSHCNSKKTEEPQDSFTKGTIHISCDESFRPVIDAQVQVYESRYPGARIIVHYKPEAECFDDIYNDSIRMIITTRFLSDAERESVSDSVGIGPDQFRVAYDAIAVIMNQSSMETAFTMKEVRDLISGNHNKELIPVFDGLKATSTVRFMIDSVLKGGKLGSNVAAAPSSEGVIDYVSKNPKAVGFIGVSWIGNPEDAGQRSLRQKVKIIALEAAFQPGAYVKPDQLNLYSGNYPMIRDLVYIVKEKHQGLAHGFGDFLKDHESGQLVFQRAYLAPSRKSFVRRPVELVD
jgi:phosphate transport system substrate-binding protein